MNMADVFFKAKRSEARSRIRSRGNRAMEVIAFTLAAVLIAGTGEASSVPPTGHDGLLVAATHPPAGILNRTNAVPMALFRTNAFAPETLDANRVQRFLYLSQPKAGTGGKNFFLRAFGIGGDVYAKNTTHTVWDNPSHNLIFRLPDEQLHLTPYLYSGTGYQSGVAGQRFEQAGGGAEWRVTKHWRLFTDVRYAFPEGGQNNSQIRAGLRLSF